MVCYWKTFHSAYVILLEILPSVSLDTVESEGLTEGVLISCTSSTLSACESTDSRLFGVEVDDDECGLSIEVTLVVDVHWN